MRWGFTGPVVAVVFCQHPCHRPRSAFYDDDTASPRVCPVCGVTIDGPPPFPDQGRTVEVRGL